MYFFNLFFFKLSARKQMGVVPKMHLLVWCVPCPAGEGPAIGECFLSWWGVLGLRQSLGGCYMSK